MPAANDNFPWLSYYGEYSFFERRMREHRQVVELILESVGVYRLILKNGSALRVFICECYSFGLAEFYEVQDELGSVNAIIICSEWCSYTDDAKLLGREKQIGLFKIRELMAALHRNDYWNCLDRDAEEHFRKRGLI